MIIESIVSGGFLKRYLRFGLSTLLFVLCLWYAGCGAVGPPIPPEDVGIEAKRLKQQQETTRPVDGMPPGEEELELPPLRPIGTR